jgi:hypothetical protein
MAGLTISVDVETGIVYLPKPAKVEGFVDTVGCTSKALAANPTKPGTKPTDVEKSLHVILEDINLRREQDRE